MGFVEIRAILRKQWTISVCSRENDEKWGGQEMETSDGEEKVRRK